ncbi:MAG: hypothetical protein E6J64_18870 [Deltaproteobacteria bacterium]|nr:MAG: hypothetical protein E6J64_18870 [Deltaproteobacteria bacterium]
MGSCRTSRQGTSMATPNASGVTALIDAARRVHRPTREGAGGGSRRRSNRAHAGERAHRFAVLPRRPRVGRASASNPGLRRG